MIQETWIELAFLAIARSRKPSQSTWEYTARLAPHVGRWADNRLQKNTEKYKQIKISLLFGDVACCVRCELEFDSWFNAFNGNNFVINSTLSMQRNVRKLLNSNRKQFIHQINPKSHQDLLKFRRDFRFSVERRHAWKFPYVDVITMLPRNTPNIAPKIPGWVVWLVLVLWLVDWVVGLVGIGWLVGWLGWVGYWLVRLGWLYMIVCLFVLVWMVGWLGWAGLGYLVPYHIRLVYWVGLIEVGEDFQWSDVVHDY